MQLDLSKLRADGKFRGSPIQPLKIHQFDGASSARQPEVPRVLEWSHKSNAQRIDVIQTARANQLAQATP
jgi:hypothetical protein